MKNSHAMIELQIICTNWYDIKLYIDLKNTKNKAMIMVEHESQSHMQNDKH